MEKAKAMTPQTKAEQKARELLIKICETCDAPYKGQNSLSYIQELTTLIQKADALDFTHNLLLRKTVHAIYDVPDPEYAGTYILKERHEVLGQGDSLLSAIQQAQKEQG